MRDVKKKILGVLFCLCLVFVSLPVLAGTTEPATDTNGVYLIGSADELRWFAAQVTDGNQGYNAKLTSAIDLQGSEDDQWQPIGGFASSTGSTFSATKYMGVFDGDGLTVSGLYIDAADQTFQGLFGYIGEGGIVKNLTVAGTITAKANLGGIAGGVAKGTISNCVNRVAITATGGAFNSYIGGIAGNLSVGTTTDNALVENCVNFGPITGTGASSGYLGGIVGHTGNNNIIRLCYNAGDIAGAAGTGYNVGGITGYCGAKAKVQYCYNTGNIQGKTVGGIVGNNYTSAETSNVYNVGAVTATAAAGNKYGGIAGASVPDLSTANCYALTGIAAGVGDEYTKNLAVTADELKGAEVLVALNSETTNFKADYTPNLNSGFPLLAWQTQSKHTVSFAGGDGASGSVPESLEIAENGTFDLPANPFTKIGHTFTGWSDGTKLYAPGDTYTVLAADVSFTAQWRLNQYTISFDSNGGTAVAVITRDYGASVSAPAEPTKAGCRFAGWYADAALTKPYSFVTMPAENITLYAAWRDVFYVIAFAGGDGVAGTAPENLDIAENGSFVLPENTFVKEGYTFSGWSDGNALYAPGETYAQVTADKTFTAQWQINQYTITFDSNGGSAVAPISQDYGTPVTKPAAPVRDGFSFTGWYVDAEISTPYTFGNMPAENRTVYAGWRYTHIDEISDIFPDAWYYDDVLFTLSHGIFRGTSATTFDPGGNITRGQFVTVLGRYAGIEDASADNAAVTGFADVKATAYYASHVAWAAENKITLGITAAAFAPEEEITREQMAAMMFRYAQVKGISLSDGGHVDVFADDARISAYAKEAIYALKATAIVDGIGGNIYAPQQFAQRAEAAKVIARLVQH